MCAAPDQGLAHDHLVTGTADAATETAAAVTAAETVRIMARAGVAGLAAGEKTGKTDGANATVTPRTEKKTTLSIPKTRMVLRTKPTANPPRVEKPVEVLIGTPAWGTVHPDSAA